VGVDTFRIAAIFLYQNIDVGIYHIYEYTGGRKYLKEEDHFEEQGIDGRKILKRSSYILAVWTEYH
jgi:hypothetical protein